MMQVVITPTILGIDREEVVLILWEKRKMPAADYNLLANTMHCLVHML